MHDWIFRKLISDYEDVKNPAVRDQYGKVAGIVGILSNTLLCVMKILVGLLSGSIAIGADGQQSSGRVLFADHADRLQAGCHAGG